MFTEKVLVEIVIGAVTIAGSTFGLMKFMISSSQKQSKQFLDHLTKQQENQQEYHEKKNGHMERMAIRFTDANKELTKSINQLSTKIEVMSTIQNAKRS